MRISIVTEGLSEFRSLPKIIPQPRSRSGNMIGQPLKVNVPPDAAPAVVARECKSRILIAVSTQKADLVVVVLDREQQQDPSGGIARAIEAAIATACGSTVPVKVVIKNRAFENWLIADLNALRAQPARFTVSAGMQRAIEPNKADTVNAIAMLKAAAKGDGYEKVDDSVRILQRMDVGLAAKHSRSFRHFLHSIGDTEYLGQCKVAV